MTWIILWCKSAFTTAPHVHVSLIAVLLEQLKLRVELWATNRRHDREDDKLFVELTAELDSIEKDAKQYEPYVEDRHDFLQKVFARYYYVAALRKIALLEEHRRELGHYGFGKMAVCYIDALDERLVLTHAEAIICRMNADELGVPVAYIETQYHNGW